MHVEHLKRHRYPRTRWKNGAGWTSEIARHPHGDPEPDTAFEWRVSIAEIDADCVFSSFAGFDRSLLVLDGEGIELTGIDAAPVLLRPRDPARSFPGESAPRCRLIGGPSRDLNVMSLRGTWSHRVLVRPLVGPMVLFPEPGVCWLIHVIGGQARRQHVADAEPIAAGDSLYVAPSGIADHQTVISGSGELVLIRFERIKGETLPL
jgi:hypothetical protein